MITESEKKRIIHEMAENSAAKARIDPTLY